VIFEDAKMDNFVFDLSYVAQRRISVTFVLSENISIPS